MIFNCKFQIQLHFLEIQTVLMLHVPLCTETLKKQNRTKKHPQSQTAVNTNLMSEIIVLPVGQKSFESDLTHALICWQQPRPVPCPVNHSTLLMYEDGVLLVINQG